MKLTRTERVYEGSDLDAMSKATNYYEMLLENIQPYIGKKILEVGAGSGTFSRYILRTHPEMLWALEPAPEVYAKLDKNLRSESRVKPLEGFLEDHIHTLRASINTAVYINVLEHIEDDERELRLIHDALTPNGYVYIYVPALPFLYGSLDEQVGHYRRYTKQSLRKALEKSGFKILHLHYSDIVGILPWFVLFRVLRAKGVEGGQVGLYDKTVVPLLRYCERIMKPPIGKNVWAIAQRI